jgi:serine/threonine-protein kinase
VSGRRAFQRDTAAETLTAILREDPPELTSAATAGVPPALVRVVQHCLEKSPAERFQSASDVAFALENLTGSGATAAQALTAKPSSPRAWLPWSVAALFALVSGALVLMNLRTPRPAAPLTRLSAQLPKDLPQNERRPVARPRHFAGWTGDLLCRRDGTWTPKIYRRSLDQRAVEPVAGTEGAYQPFFSPDGQWIAFFTIVGELKKVPRDGGPSVISVRGLKNGQWGFGVWRSDARDQFSTLKTCCRCRRPAACRQR